MLSSITRARLVPGTETKSTDPSEDASTTVGPSMLTINSSQRGSKRIIISSKMILGWNTRPSPRLTWRASLRRPVEWAMVRPTFMQDTMRCWTWSKLIPYLCVEGLSPEASKISFSKSMNYWKLTRSHSPRMKRRSYQRPSIQWSLRVEEMEWMTLFSMLLWAEQCWMK